MFELSVTKQYLQNIENTVNEEFVTYAQTVIKYLNNRIKHLDFGDSWYSSDGKVALYQTQSETSSYKIYYNAKYIGLLMPWCLEPTNMLNSIIDIFNSKNIVDSNKYAKEIFDALDISELVSDLSFLEAVLFVSNKKEDVKDYFLCYKQLKETNNIYFMLQLIDFDMSLVKLKALTQACQ